MPRYPVPTLLPISIENGSIYLESVVQDPQSQCRGLAVVAHPLGRLGGSLDDPVVSHLSALLLSHYHLRVVRFNSRGVGKSTGSPSWTGSSESKDFQELVVKCLDNYCLDFPEASRSQIVIAGYSAGSLYATTVKLVKDLYDLKQFKGGPKPRYILISFPAGVQWALSLFSSKTYNDALKSVLSSRVTGTAADQPQSPVAAVSPLPSLVPPLNRVGDNGPPSPVEASEREQERMPSNHAGEPLASHVLAIYGDQDQFTGLKTYQTWTKQWQLEAPSPLAASTSESAQQNSSTPSRSTFHATLVPGADHFWRTQAALDGLDEAIVRWMDDLND